MRAQFDSEQRIELFEFVCTDHEEYISRKLVIDAAKPQHNWVKEWHKVNTQDSKQSPEMSKKGKGKQMKSPQSAPPDITLPGSSVKQSVGLTEAVNQFLEVSITLPQQSPRPWTDRCSPTGCRDHGPDEPAIHSLPQPPQHWALPGT